MPPHESDANLSQHEFDFKVASTSQTDNVQPRRTRLELFYRKWVGEDQPDRDNRSCR